MTTATTDLTPRQFFTNEVLKRVHYKDWRFGVRSMPLSLGGQFSMGYEEQLVIYIPLPDQERKPKECWDHYQFTFWLYESVLDGEIYDMSEWMFNCVIMHIERLFAEASFLYGDDRLMLTDDSLEIVGWHIVQQFSY